MSVRAGFLAFLDVLSRQSGYNIARENSRVLRRRLVGILIALCSVALVTFLGHKVVPVDGTTVGFAYLLAILIVASAWGFLEAALASILATVLFNSYFLPPVGTFTTTDPENWVVLSTFLTTSLIATRLSAKAKARASEAIERQRDLDRDRPSVVVEWTQKKGATRLCVRTLSVVNSENAPVYASVFDSGATWDGPLGQNAIGPENIKRAADLMFRTVGPLQCVTWLQRKISPDTWIVDMYQMVTNGHSASRKNIPIAPGSAPPGPGKDIRTTFVLRETNTGLRVVAARVADLRLSKTSRAVSASTAE